MSLPEDIVGGDGRFTDDDHAQHHNQAHGVVNRVPVPETGDFPNNAFVILKRSTQIPKGFVYEFFDGTQEELDGTELAMIVKNGGLTFVSVSELVSEGGGGNGGGITSHNDLNGRSAAAAHPIGSITGLDDVLTSLDTDLDEHGHSLADLDLTGTPSATTILHGDGQWREQPDEAVDTGWVSLSLIGNWANVDDSLAVRRVGRIVQMAGLIVGEAITSNAPVTGIPMGFRPGRALIVGCATLLDDSPLTAGQAVGLVNPTGGSTPADVIILDDANNDQVPYFISGVWSTSDSPPS